MLFEIANINRFQFLVHQNILQHAVCTYEAHDDFTIFISILLKTLIYIKEIKMILYYLNFLNLHNQFRKSWSKIHLTNPVKVLQGFAT